MVQSDESTSSDSAPFASFWQDMAGSATEAARAGQQISSEMLGQMRQAFVESLRRYMDDYVRSGQFSQMLQNVLTQAVSFRGQLADFVSSAMKTTLMPEIDPEKIGDAVRTMEQRGADRFDELAERIEHLEHGPRKGGRKSSGKPKSAAKRSAKPKVRAATRGARKSGATVRSRRGSRRR